MSTIELHLGQIVQWPPSPIGIAEVIELRRRCVRLYYERKNGRARQPIVRVDRLVRRQRQALLPIENPFNRAIVRAASKRFILRNN